MSNSQLVKLPSRFDYGYHKQFNETCSELINSAEVNEIILDFTIVEYLDSSALGMLVMMQKKASNSSKKIKIKNVKGATEEILRMANIQRKVNYEKHCRNFPLVTSSTIKWICFIRIQTIRAR